jgi:predicted nucleic acid-binding protein
MILVVADTGPINYLIQIGQIELLGQLVEKAVLPASVKAELSNKAAPDAVRAWAASPPAWVETRAAARLVEAKDLSNADREAITLALELNATLLLMDDQQARRCAHTLGVATLGTIGLLEAAAARELVSLSSALEKLRGTSFYITDELIENALQRDAARRRVPRADGPAL